MARARLTRRNVDRFKPDLDKDVIVWDEDLPGFGLRLRPSGVRSWIVQYRNAQNRSRRVTLARLGVLTPDEARKEARRILGQVAQGADPAEQRAELRVGVTVKELVDRYLNEHAETKKKPSSVKADRVNLAKHVIPALGQRRVVDVTRADVAKLHHAMRKTPGAANRVLALISKMFNLAERWGLRPDGTNPARHLERYAEKARERFLSNDELARLGDALRKEEIEVQDLPREARRTRLAGVTAIRLLTFTGCRVGEILNLRWEDVDLERGLLRFPDSKTGAKTIPLNAATEEVLRAIPRGASGWAIEGKRAGRPLVNLAKPWERIRTRAALEDVRLHDLRHSFASVAAGSGVALPMIGKLLGHTQPATTQRYAHLSDDPLRQVSDDVGARIAHAMGDGTSRRLTTGRSGD
jgi:integrase